MQIGPSILNGSVPPLSYNGKCLSVPPNKLGKTHICRVPDNNYYGHFKFISSVKIFVLQLAAVEEEDEEVKRRKRKKHKKEKKRKEKEREEMDRETNVDQNKGDSYEKKLSNIILQPNIQGEVGDKPEPAEKLFHKTSERGLRPAVSIEDNSRTDNMPSPYSARRRTGGSLDVKPVMPHASNASMNWSPRRNLSERDISDDENEVKSHIGLRKRMTQERMQRYISSDSENDLEAESGRFLSKLKKEKKKKKKSRQTSDTE